MNDTLRFANDGIAIERTTTLTVDSSRKSGGIDNTLFSVRESEPVTMKSTFWIEELKETDKKGKPTTAPAIFTSRHAPLPSPRQDGFPERMVWPHITIATPEKVPAGYALKPA